jgi:putative methyltransferase (TIGR04325 family)
MSDFKALLKIIPGMSIVRKFRYARYFEKSLHTNLFHQTFPDFKSAEIAAPKTLALGYDNENSANMYDEYTQNIGAVDYPAIFWMERLREEVKSVYDFGGHVGIKYYAYSKFLSSDLNWTTYDVPAVVSRGRQLAADKKVVNLKFSDNLKDLENGFDLFFVSGSFQYIENPIDLVFKGLKNKPKYVLINMMTLHETLTTVTIQNIGTAFCPYKIFQKSTFLKQLKDYGYESIAEWKNAEKYCEIPFHKNESLYGYTGLLLKLV